jgi:hypothetical protein
VLAEVANPQERSWLDELSSATPSVHHDRVLFSAKESVYKAWFPLARRWLGFEDAVVRIDPRDSAGGVFSAELLVEGPRLGDRLLTGFSGRWLVCDGLVLTAIAVEAAGASDAAGAGEAAGVSKAAGVSAAANISGAANVGAAANVSAAASAARRRA